MKRVALRAGACAAIFLGLLCIVPMLGAATDTSEDWQRCPPGTKHAGQAPWGYADLHTHPASHLAWGSEVLGDGGVDIPTTRGLLWGSPGMRLEDSDPSRDLAACNPDSHQPSAWPWPRSLLRGVVVGVEDSVTNFPHRVGGAPDFKGWPDSQSLPHQMMHVSWLHRAWEGGLRFLIADTVDTEAIALGWQQGFCGNGCANAQGHLVDGELVRPIAGDGGTGGFDWESAHRQIDFIKALANKNSTWMQVVTNSHEALTAVCDDRMAVVLGVEMDELTVGEIFELHDAGVEHVIPIHLANSAVFGGSAVYGDFFNTNTRFLTGNYYQLDPAEDPTLPFRLSPQLEYLRAGPIAGLTDLMLPAIRPHDQQYCPRYGDCRQDGGTVRFDGGQINALGLIGDGGPLLAIMTKGLLIDVAHMGDNATKATLDLAEHWSYPVMDSHTSVERSSGFGRNSERDLKFEFAERIFKGGGMVGLGTGPYTDSLLVGHWTGNVAMQLNPGGRFIEKLVSARPPSPDEIKALTLQFWSPDNKPPRRGLRALLFTEDGRAFPVSSPALAASTWRVPACEFDTNGGYCLPREVERQIVGCRLDLESGNGTTISGIAVSLELLHDSPLPVLERFGNPLTRLTRTNDWATSSFRSPQSGGAPIDRLTVTVKTGTNRLPGGENDNAAVQVLVRGADSPANSPANLLKGEKPRRHHRRHHVRRKGLRIASAVTGNEPEIPPVVLQTPFNAGLPLQSGSTHSVEVSLPPNTKPEDILSVDLLTWFITDKLGLETATTWDVERAEVAFGGGTPPIAVQSESPWAQLTSENPRVSIYETYDRPPGHDSPIADHFMVTVVAGSDLQATDDLQAIFRVRSCGEHGYSLNDGLKWSSGSVHSVMVKIGCAAVPHPTLDQVEAFGLAYVTPGNDTLKLSEISLEVLSNPIANWLRDYRNLMRTAGSAGVAMGTDINGLAQQIAYSEDPVTFPYHPGANQDVLIDGGCTTSGHTFDLTKNGISQIGMVPDFLEAVRELDGGASPIEKMYRSAAQAIEMWHRVELSPVVQK